MLIACKACHRQYDVEGMREGDHVRCRCGELAVVPRARPRNARVLHCSGCGGKLKDKARKCEYCGCEISIAERNLGPACPECFANLPAGACFCSGCGVEIRPEAIRATRASARCPRCAGDLALLEFAGGHYTECAGCGGIWLDAGSFEKVIEEKDLAALEPLVRGPARDRGGAKADEGPQPVKYLPCPVCSNLMNRKNFAGASGVIIDWCRSHGYWFDTHELEKVVRFIRDGGLDQARKRDIERARGELQALEERKRRAAGAGAAWESERRSFSAGIDWADALGKLAGSLRSLMR